MGLFSKPKKFKNKKEELIHGLTDEQLKERQKIKAQIINALIDERYSVQGLVKYNDIMLKKDEKIILSVPDVRLLEPRAVRVSSGGGAGVSFKVGKRARISTGQGKGVSKSVDQITHIDTGKFYITTKQVIFVGAKKSIKFPIRKIISITPYVDGIKIAREGKTKTEIFVTDEITLNNNGYKFVLNGDFIKPLIENYY